MLMGSVNGIFSDIMSILSYFLFLIILRPCVTKSKESSIKKRKNANGKFIIQNPEGITKI